MQKEFYEASDDFFELFESDTFEREEEGYTGNEISSWRGFVGGIPVAGFDFETNEGWYDDTVI